MLGWVYYVQALCLLSSTSFLSKGLRGYSLQKGRENSIWGNDTRHFKDHLKSFQVLATTVQTGWEMSPLIFYLLLLRWVPWYQCIKWRDSRGIKVKEITDKVEMVIWPKNTRNKLLIRIFVFWYPCYWPIDYAVPKIALNIFSHNNTFYVYGQKDDLNSQWSSLASDSSSQTRLLHIYGTAWLTGLVGSIEGRPTTLHGISIVNFPPNHLQTNKQANLQTLSRITILRREENINPCKVAFCLWSVANFQNTGWSTKFRDHGSQMVYDIFN